MAGRRIRRVPLAALTMLAGLSAGPALAQAKLEVVPVRSLDFGSLVLLGSGSKQIDPDGTTTSQGLSTVKGAREGPAEFVLVYRPGAKARNAIVQVTLEQAGTLVVKGTTGTLSNLTTDLSGGITSITNRTMVVKMTACAPPSCSLTFHIGGKLALVGGGADAQFTFPLQVTARLVAEN